MQLINNLEITQQLYREYVALVKQYKVRAYAEYTETFEQFVNLLIHATEFEPSLDSDYRLKYQPKKWCRFIIFSLGWHSSVQKSRSHGFSFKFNQYLTLEIYENGTWKFDHFTCSSGGGIKGITRNLMPDLTIRTRDLIL